jgi:DNA-binding beta-propeller fold protein YncE
MRRFACLASLLLLLSVSAARADKLVLVAGGGDGADGTEAAKAKLIVPFGVDFFNGRVLIVEMAKGERLRAISREGKILTVAGKEGEKGNTGDGGDPLKATFNGMHSIALGPDGIYLADTWNNRVRLIESGSNSLIVTAFAGTGEKGFSGDGGPAKDAKFGGCFCVSFDPEKKNLFITDLDNRRIRKVNMETKIVTTVAGNGEKGIPKDGEDATKQPLVDPRAHAVDKDGNIWILERGGHALRVVDAKGKIRTVAGNGKKGMGTGKALEAEMNGPKHLCIDRDGTVLIADTENHRIVRFNPKDNTLTLVAGTGKKGNTLGDGDPLKADFSQPHGVNVHPKTGDIYISDAGNNRVLKIVREK